MARSERNRSRSPRRSPSRSSFASRAGSPRRRSSPPRQAHSQSSRGHRASSPVSRSPSRASRSSSPGRGRYSSLPRSSPPPERSSSPGQDSHSRSGVRRRSSVVISEDEEAAHQSKKKKEEKLPSATQPGRGIRKIVDLFHDLSALINKADKHAALDVLEPEELEAMDKEDFMGLTEDQIEEERKDRRRCFKAVQLLNKLIPGFSDQAHTAVNLSIFLSPLQTGANDARSDDTGKLKIAMANWLNQRLFHPTPPLSPLDKSERGVNNDFTGRLLCPIDYDWQDLSVRAKLRAAEPDFDMASSFFIRCLYEDEEGDPECPEVGFLKGPLLILTFRNIFTAPSSAANGNTISEPRSRRRDVASLLHLNGQVTPRSIAYAATQLLFSLNTARDWKSEHAGFHYPSFYNFVVDFFEVIEDNMSRQAVNELLQWWNRQIFPPASRRSGASSAAARASEKRLIEARAKRAQDEADRALARAERISHEAERARDLAERCRAAAEEARTVADADPDLAERSEPNAAQEEAE